MRLADKRKIFLAPFSFIYFLAASARNILYDLHVLKRYSVSAKTISVGNITWGGTGKTPAVLFLLQYFLRQNRRVSVLIRGYGKDEPELFSNFTPGVPVLVGKNRVKTAREAVAKYSSDIILLDDGFQHRRLRRDMDIVCIDAANPFGNGWVIPGGSLREGLSGLKRADIFLITKIDLARDEKTLQDLRTRLGKINRRALIVESIHEVRNLCRALDGRFMDAEELKNKDVALVSAIGSPDSFEKTILNLGLAVKKHFIFRDHHWYTQKDLRKIKDFCIKNNIDTIITTEKDAVRLKPFTLHPSPLNLFILGIQLKIIKNEQEFYNRLSGVCNN